MNNLYADVIIPPVVLTNGYANQMTDFLTLIKIIPVKHWSKIYFKMYWYLIINNTIVRSNNVCLYTIDKT